MSIITVLHTIAGLFFLVTGIVALSQAPRSKVNRSFLLMALFSTIWSLGTGFQWIAATKDQAFFWNKFASIGFLIVPGLLLVFVMLLCKSGTKPVAAWKLILSLVPGVVLLVVYLFFDTFITSSFEKTSLGWKELSEGISPWYMVFILYYSSLTIFSIIILAKKYKATGSSDVKKQSVVLAVTLGTSALLSAVNESLLPDMLKITSIPKISSIIFIIWGAGTLYVLLKYRFKGFDDSSVGNNEGDSTAGNNVAKKAGTGKQASPAGKLK